MARKAYGNQRCGATMLHTDKGPLHRGTHDLYVEDADGGYVEISFSQANYLKKSGIRETLHVVPKASQRERYITVEFGEPKQYDALQKTLQAFLKNSKNPIKKRQLAGQLALNPRAFLRQERLSNLMNGKRPLSRRRSFRQKAPAMFSTALTITAGFGVATLTAGAAPIVMAAGLVGVSATQIVLSRSVKTLGDIDAHLDEIEKLWEATDPEKAAALKTLRTGESSGWAKKRKSVVEAQAKLDASREQAERWEQENREQGKKSTHDQRSAERTAEFTYQYKRGYRAFKTTISPITHLKAAMVDTPEGAAHRALIGATLRAHKKPAVAIAVASVFVGAYGFSGLDGAVEEKIADLGVTIGASVASDVGGQLAAATAVTGSGILGYSVFRNWQEDFTIEAITELPTVIKEAVEVALDPTKRVYDKPPSRIRNFFAQTLNTFDLSTG